MKKKLNLLLLLISNYLVAQISGDVAQNYGRSPDFNNIVKKVAVQSDGKILAGGYFTSYNGITANRIIRLNSDGSRDTSFNTGTGFDDSIESIVVQNDGKILLGGYFRSYNGGGANRLIRLNRDGSKDTSFNIGTGFDDYIKSIAIQSDGKIVVGGNFTAYKGVNAGKVIRLNTDGSIDSSFSTGTGFDANVASIALQNDGKILIIGVFLNYNDENTGRLIRLNTNGTKDNSFLIGTGISGYPESIIVQNDGKILIGGIISYYDNIAYEGIIRINANGTIDNSFAYNASAAIDYVTAMTLQNDGKIIIGGFSDYERKIIRLNSNGSVDNNISTGTGFNSDIYSIAIQTDEKIVVGGWFRLYNDTTANYIIRFNTNSTVDTSFFSNDAGLNGDVYSISIQNDGKILIGGDFNNYKRASEKKLLRLNNDGTKDTSFTTGTGFDSFVYATSIQNDGKIIAGGGFKKYNGTTSNNIIRLNSNGTIDNNFTTGSGFNGSVYTLALQNDGKILVGGKFTSYNGTTENGLIRLNSNGTKDTTFTTGIGFNGYVYSIVVQNDGKILIGGWFSTYNGTTSNEIIRLNPDGSIDNSFDPGIGFNTYIVSIFLQNDGKILVVGAFTTFNGVAENRIIRLNNNGSKDNSFNTGTGFNNDTYTIISQNDGKILIGGNFSTYNGSIVNRIIRLNNDGSQDLSFITGSAFDDYVSCIAQVGDKIHIGGAFTTYKNSTFSNNFITLSSEVLSTNSFEENTAFDLYPNPAKDVLNIQIKDDQTISSVKVYDLQGKEMIHCTSNTVPLNHLSPGLYLAKIKTENGELSKKFIKE